MKWLVLTLAAVVLTGGFITLKSHAAENGVAPTYQRGELLKRLADKLDLTPDQRAQIRDIIVADRDNLQSLLGQLHESRVALRTAIRADSPTETGVRAASANVAAVEANLAVERMKLYSNIKPVLTDAQRAKLAQLEANFDGLADSLIARIGTD